MMRRHVYGIGVIALGLVIGSGASTSRAEETPAARDPATQPAPPQVKAPTKPDEYLSQDQLVQAYREGQHGLVVRETARILGNPRILESYNRFSLLVLRAESQLQGKSFDAALKTLEDAASAAPDADKRAVMVATRTMIQKRSGLRYLSFTTDDRGAPIYPSGFKGNKPVPIDILTLSKREAVFRALCWDLAADIRGDLLGITQYDRLALVDKALDKIDSLSVLETAARGGQEETDKLKKEFAVAIEAGLARQLVFNKKRVQQIDAAGQELETVSRLILKSQSVPPGAVIDTATSPTEVPEGAVRIRVKQPRGLSRQAVVDLENISEACRKIPKGIDTVVERLKADSKPFDPVVKEAAAMHDNVDKLIERYKSAGLLR